MVKESNLGLLTPAARALKAVSACTGALFDEAVFGRENSEKEEIRVHA